MKVSNICKNYYSGFLKIRNFKTNNCKTNILALLIIFSSCTLVIPLGLAVLYGIASLCGRINKKQNLSACDENVNKQCKKVILKRDDVKNTISNSEVVISAKMKEEIAKEKVSQKEMKEEYAKLSADRKLPQLLGYNQYAPHTFAMLMPGIALIAALLSKKNKLTNLWVCQSSKSFQDKLKEIKNSPDNQRHALIVPTHSSMNSASHPKTEDWEQHKMTICVEKIDGHMHIYVLETMLADWNSITKSQINLKEGTRFTEQELVLAHIDAVGLNQKDTTVYVPVTRREFAGGCSTFALRDAVYFLRDAQFTNKLVISPTMRMTLPDSNIGIKNIEALPPECMQMTQSMTILNQYQEKYKNLAAQQFGRPSKLKSLQKSLEKHVVAVENRRQNLYISHRVLKYQALILEMLKQKTDEEINALISCKLL